MTAVDREARRRQTEANRARMRRVAKRKEEDMLQDQAKGLKVTNERLKREYEQLEMLLKYAQSQLSESCAPDCGIP